jgi:hypothetical protein
MGIRTRGLDISINAKRQTADSAERAEAKGVVDRRNKQLAAGREIPWSPTIRAALIAGTPWLDVYCPGCGTSRALDLPPARLGRHAGAGLALLVVPRVGADAENSGPARAAAGGDRRWLDGLTEGGLHCQASGPNLTTRRGTRSICWSATLGAMVRLCRSRYSSR